MGGVIAWLGCVFSAAPVLAVHPEFVAVTQEPAKPTEQEPAKPFTEADFDANLRQVMERDGFPVLDNPPVVDVAGVSKRISANEMVIGVVVNGEARAYPIAVMGVHELANDSVGDVPIAVSW